MRSPEEYGKEKSIGLNKLSGPLDIESLSDVALLTQAGYLTLKKVADSTAYVNYPNLELRKAMAQLYLRLLLDVKLAGQVGAGAIVAVLSEESAESVFHILNRLFASIDYKNYPVRDEASVRTFVQVYFSGAGLEPKVEQHNAHGRSDLEVKVNNRRWVFEFKVVCEGQSQELKLQEATDQLISRQYGRQYETDELMRVALIYSINDRRFVKWAAI